jgi:ribosomal protein L40E
MRPYRKLSKHPEAAKSRRRRREYRRKLIAILGGKCRKCGGDQNLEPHHTQPRTWRSHERWAMSRLLVYLQEARMGILELLCRKCNAEEGAPDSGEDW